MRRLLGCAAFATVATLFAMPAMAADLRVKAPVLKAPAAVATYGWSGCYVGAFAGYQSARVDAPYGANSLGVAPGTASSDTLRPNGIMLGPTIGCNYQWDGRWVVGVEGDLDFIKKEDTKVETAFPAFRLRVEQQWLATARVRIGYAFDRGFILPWPLLFYLTGGAAWASVEAANFVPGNPTSFVAQKQTHVGWVAGFGSEYGLGKGWSVKSETLYIDLGKRSYFTPTDPVALAVFNIKPRLWVSKVGLNYRFHWNGPLTARY
jgi:outer membrane immunogenic protein